jgi:diphthamide synthase (EF-2-diphthine--ammonia ligase)
MSYIASWSGGKDSCLALYEVMGKAARGMAEIILEAKLLPEQ